MGRVLRMISRARLRYFRLKTGSCSVKFLSTCGRPASTRATFNPASDRRLQAQPPESSRNDCRTLLTEWPRCEHSTVALGEAAQVHTAAGVHLLDVYLSRMLRSASRIQQF